MDERAKRRKIQFFDRVNHDVLMERLARKLTDKRVLMLVRR